jgi:hypothetical protein
MGSLIHLLPFDPERWDAIETAFRDAPLLSMQVIGKIHEGRAATRGTVQAGWQEGWLWAFAILEDHDIFTTATAHNQWMWERGDVLEVFLRRAGETAYREVHVTPNNYRLLLEFPDEHVIARQRSGEETDRTRYCGDPMPIQSRVRVEPMNNRWQALVGIPMETVPGQTWHLSFCRYDAAESKKPVTYSTTPFTVGDFHRQQEWEAYTLSDARAVPSPGT